MKHLKTVCILLLTLLLSQLTYSLSPDTDSLEIRLTQLEKEIKKIKEEKTPSFLSTVQVGGQAFLYYTYTTKGIDGNDFNKFDFERMYINVKADVFSEGKFVYTSDVFRNAATGSYYSGLAMRVKYAYFDYAPVKNLSLKIGMIPTSWIGFVDSYWKYRALASTPADRYGYFASSDLGFSASYALPNKIGEISGYIFNGGGYAAAETNRFKDFSARLNLAPFQDNAVLKGLTVAGFYYKGSNLSSTATSADKNRYGAFIGYSYNILSVNGEYIAKEDASLTNNDSLSKGNVVAFFGEIKAPFESLKNKLSLVWRYDIIEPNIDKGGDMYRLGIIGAAYKLNDRVTFVLDHQFQNAETSSFKRADGVKIDADKKWFLHTIVNF